METVLGILKDLLKISVFRRLIVVSLIPNVLVLGFAMSGISNKNNFLWASLIGPYWWLEKTVVAFTFYAAMFTVAFKIGQWFFVVLQNSQNEESSAKFAVEQENQIPEPEPLDNSYHYAEVAARMKREFEAKPQAEKEEILRQGALEQQRLTAQWAKEIAHITNAKSQRQTEQEADHIRATGTEYPNMSPEAVRARALRELTGRYG